MIHGGDIYSNEIEHDFSVNLNPLGIPQSIENVMREGLKLARYYPDYNQAKARLALSKLENVSINNVVASSGVSELLMAIVRAENPKKALVIEPGFSGYRYALESLNPGREVIKGEGFIELRKIVEKQRKCEIDTYFIKENPGADNDEAEFILDEKLLSVIDNNLDILFIQDPINPVGNNVSNELLITILKKAYENNVTVVLDESFIYMSDKALAGKVLSSSEILKYNPNTYIVKSFTKIFSVPGIRVGYAVASEENIFKLWNQLPEWHLSSVAEQVIIEGSKLVSLISLISKEEFVKETCEVINAERAYLKEELEKLGVIVYKSDTVFVLIKSEKELLDSLLKRKILIRDCKYIPGLGEGYYRIAVKSHEENEILIDALKDIFK